MEIKALTLVAQASSEVPIGAIVAIGVFVLLIALFAVAWVRKRKRGLEEAEEGRETGERPATGEEELAEEEEAPTPKSAKLAPAPAEQPVVVPRDGAPVAPKDVHPEGVAVEDKAAAPVFVLGEARSMHEGLEKTAREGFVARLGKLFRGKEIDASLVAEVEEVMFTSDVGVQTAQRLLDGMRAALSRRELSDEKSVWGYLRKETKAILDEAAQKLPERPTEGPGPRVIMVIGVNGTGKTTSIGKLAARYKAEGRRILLAAGDTFRAAAVEQLEVWARRVEVDIHKGKERADPASVVFDAVERAKAEGHDLVIVDTAGRLHTQVNLMEELKKVHRVIGKAAEGAPHEVLLVLDATTGQNAIQQAQIFGGAVQVTGITLTKLDGTAKGGVVIGICDQLDIPIRWVGVGERVQDLRRFDSGDFVAALYGG